MPEMEDIGCEGVIERLLAFIDQELSERDRGSVERHLRMCRACFSRMEFERRLKQRLSALASGDAPPASRQRIRDLIKRF